jgi:small subunit ribosomal protein S20
MSHSKSAAKRLRQAEARRVRNRSTKARIRTLSKKIDAAPEDQKEAVLREGHSTIDKAAARGAIHRNTAARRKSRLAKRLAAAAKKAASPD